MCVCGAAGSAYHLKVSEVLWSCLKRCWSDGIYMAPLVHRFWKITLQLYSRYSKFLHEVTYTHAACLDLNLHPVPCPIAASSGLSDSCSFSYIISWISCLPMVGELY